MNKGVSIVYRNAFKDERNVRKKLFGSGIVYRVQNAFTVMRNGPKCCTMNSRAKLPNHRTVHSQYTYLVQHSYGPC